MNTILLVDDEPRVRAMIRDTLESSGYDVIEARDAAEACQVERAVARPIDLLLTDVSMPGSTGPDLAHRLRPRRPRMKVIYMSAFTVVDFDNRRIDLDPRLPILAKPFSGEVLTKKVRHVLNTQHAAGQRLSERRAGAPGTPSH